MTLLALDLPKPVAEAIHSERALLGALGAMGHQAIPYLMSFITRGIFWNGQEAQLSYFARGNRHLTWIHLAFLFCVTLLPFSTGVPAEFIAYRSALLPYRGNILPLGAALYGSGVYARCAGLLNPEATAEVDRAMRRRILIEQALYAGGAPLRVVNAWVSIVAIILVQLNYAIAPSFRARGNGRRR